MRAGPGVSGVNTSSVYPGHEYEARVAAVYVDHVTSAPARAYLVTALPSPAGFRVFAVGSGLVRLEWDFLRFAHYQRDDEQLLYVVRLFDGLDGEQRQRDEKVFRNSSLVERRYSAALRNLTPGRAYNVTLHARLREQRSVPSSLRFRALRLHLALDVAILFEMAPNLQDRDVLLTRRFLRALANCYETDDVNNVR